MKVAEKYANQKFGGMNMMTFTESEKCAHENGWFITITCLFGLITRRIFVCSDCGDWKDVK